MVMPLLPLCVSEVVMYYVCMTALEHGTVIGRPLHHSVALLKEVVFRGHSFVFK